MLLLAHEAYGMMVRKRKKMKLNNYRLWILPVMALLLIGLATAQFRGAPALLAQAAPAQGPHISIVLIDIHKQPVSNWQFLIYFGAGCEGEFPFTETMTGEDGRARVDFLSPMTYSVKTAFYDADTWEMLTPECQNVSVTYEGSEPEDVIFQVRLREEPLPTATPTATPTLTPTPTQGPTTTPTPIFPGCPDYREPDGSFAQAHLNILGGGESSYICTVDDEDYFLLQGVKLNEALEVTLRFLPHPYALTVYNPFQQQAAHRASASGEDVTLLLTPNLAGTWYAKVSGNGHFDPHDTYNVRAVQHGCVLDPLEPNNGPDAASTVALNTPIHYLTLCPSGDEDWYKVTLGVEDNLIVRVEHDNSRGQAYACLYAPGSSAPTRCATAPTASQVINFIATQAGEHRIRVYGATGQTVVEPYSLILTVNNPTPTPTVTPTATATVATATPTPTPTPTVTPTPTPTLAPPAAVVFVPGIGGSVLESAWGKEYWPQFPSACAAAIPFWPAWWYPSGCHAPLTRDQADPDYIASMRPREVLRQLLAGGVGYLLPELDIYNRVIDAFTSAGFRPYEDLTCQASKSHMPNFFLFPYDWRLDNNITAQRLQTYIEECVQQVWPGRKVNIVAHSMGGLVARRYIMQNPQSHGVQALVTVNTPWLGAPQILPVFEEGDWLPIIHPADARRIAPTLSGAHQLLPNELYFRLAPLRPLKEGFRDRDGNGVDWETYSYTRYIANLDRFYGGVPGITPPGTQVHNFHSVTVNGLHQSNWITDTTDINYYHLYSVEQTARTIGQMWYIQPPLFGKGIYVDHVPGDGTVPTASQIRTRPAGSNYNKPGATLWQPATGWALPPFDYDKAYRSHNGVLRNSSVHQRIFRHLRDNWQPGLFPSAAQQRLTAAPTDDGFEGIPESFEIRPARYLVVYGAQEISFDHTLYPELYPEPSRRAGNDALPPYIPGMVSHRLGEQMSMFVLNNDFPYSLTMTATLPIMALELRVGTHEQTERQVRYLDVPAAVGQPFRLALAEDGSVQNLRTDLAGDGLFETALDPTVDVSGEAASDVTPPQVQAQVERGEGLGFTVTLTATDAEGGPVQIFVSDRDWDYQPYTGALAVDGTQTPRLYAFAQDPVGNRSGLLEVVLARQIFLPTVIR